MRRELFLSYFVVKMNSTFKGDQVENPLAFVDLAADAGNNKLHTGWNPTTQGEKFAIAR